MRNKVILGLLCSLCSLSSHAQPLFDAHLHYSEQMAEQITPQQIVTILKRNQIRRAAITGTPAHVVDKLLKVAPDLIVPILGVYSHANEKASWLNNQNLIGELSEQLKKSHWQAIGEIHLFAQDRHNPLFAQIIGLASKHKLPLLLHADPAVIDSVYDIAPAQTVVWAHAGTYPYPDLIANYLERYPHLMIDVSKRDERIAPNGVIDEQWYELFINYPQRVLIGVDTYSSARWHNFDRVAATIRHWLGQLPEDIAEQLAFKNAATLYLKFE